jgi:hypothetical protein
MSRYKKIILDKKRLLREQDHLTRSPRLEGAVKEAMMQTVRKKKKIKPDTSRESTRK